MDETIEKLDYQQPTENMDDDTHLKVGKYIQDKGNIYPFETKISMNIDYERSVTTYNYNGYGDIFTKLGGLKASLGPILGFITPFVMLYFLILLAGIIQESYTLKY